MVLNKKLNISFYNLIANYIGKAWSLASAYVFMPLYIKLLGNESFGFIGFYILFFSIVSLADLGFSAAITKEFAQKNSKRYKKALFLKIEKIFILICISVALLSFFSAKFIVLHWLKLDLFTIERAIFCVRLIGISSGLQLFTAIHFGALMGLDKQVNANVIQFLWSVCRTLGSVLILYFFSPTIELFLYCQIVSHILYLCLLRSNLFKSIHDTFYTQKVKSLKKIPATILHFSAGMSIIAIFSAINNQTDRILASKLLVMSEFGVYSVLATIGQIPFFVCSPIVITIFPRISAYYSEGRLVELDKILRSYSFLMNTVAMAIVFTAIFYTQDIFSIFFKNSISVDKYRVYVQVSQILSLGYFFLVLQLIPFYLLMAKSQTRPSILVGIFQMIVTAPLTLFLNEKFGIIGIALPWLITNLAAFIFLKFKILKGGHKIYNNKSEILLSYLLPLLSFTFLFFILNYFKISIFVGLFFVIVTVMLNLFLYNRSSNNENLLFLS